MSIIFVFWVTAISLLSIATLTYADSASDPAEALRAGVILEAGEIDSSTVEVGAFAVVIHGQGERHPVSGEWKGLETVRGYIQAVDGETLTLAMGRKGRPKPVTLERIQTLVLVGSPTRRGVEQAVRARSNGLPARRSPQPQDGRTDSTPAGGEMEATADRANNADAIASSRVKRRDGPAAPMALEHFQVLADSGHAAGDAEALRAGVILEAGEIDSSTVKVGAYAVVVHGQGERHPLSGEWEQLVTTRGYVQAVDAKDLTLARARDPRQDRIALKRIQTLVLVGSLPLTSADRESRLADIVVDEDSRDGGSGPGSLDTPFDVVPDTDGTVDTVATAVAEPPRSKVAEDSLKAAASRRLVTKYSQHLPGLENRKKRLAVKFGAGAYGGTLLAVAGFWIGVPYNRCAEDIEQDAPICIGGPPLQWASIGHLVGTAFGVTIVDPYDKVTLMYALAGSWVGKQVVRELDDRAYDKLPSTGVFGYLSGTVAAGVLVGVPAVVAAFASEGMRGFHEERRFSVGLAPGPRGRLSAVAALRF